MNISVKLMVVAFVMFAGCSKPFEFTEIQKVELQYKNSSEIESTLLESDKSWKYQVAAWDASYIGNYHQCLKLWDHNASAHTAIDKVFLQSFQSRYNSVGAIEYISEQAKNHSTVIINEAHHQPLHRNFTTKLLIPLHEQGYRYLGLETLSDHDTLLNQRGYPLISSGNYSKEPQFGNLIREAIEIGFKVFPYEWNRTEDDDREIAQAQNILDEIRKDSSSKYLIHCGFAHAVEGNYPSWGKAMAGRLKEISGTDPLTINQTAFTEKSKDIHNHGLLNQAKISQPTVFVNHSNESFKNPKDSTWNDIMVFHPKSK